MGFSLGVNKIILKLERSASCTTMWVHGYNLKWLIACCVNFTLKKTKQIKSGNTEAAIIESNIYTQNWIKNNCNGKLILWVI